MRILRARLLAAAQEEAERGGVRRAPQPGPHRRPLRAGAHLQLPGEPHPRPPRRLQGATTWTRCSTATSTRVDPGAASTPTSAAKLPRPCHAERRARRPWTCCSPRWPRPPHGWPRPACPRRGTTPRSWPRTSLGVERGELHAVARREFDAALRGVRRRAARPREPLQHITGRAYFRYLELAVGPGVFVPRPETEVVVGCGASTRRVADGRRRPAGRRPVHRLGRDRAGRRPRGARGAGARGRAGPGRRSAGRRATCAGIDGRPAAGRHAPTAFPELDGRSTSWSATRRTSRWASGDPRPRGARPRPGARAVVRGGRPGRDARSSSARRAGCCGPAALLVVEHADLQGSRRRWSSPRPALDRGRRPPATSPAATATPPPDPALTAVTAADCYRAARTIRAPRRRADAQGRRYDMATRGASAGPASRGRGTARRARRAADRHGLRHRRRRLPAGRRGRPAGGQGPRPGHARAGARRLAPAPWTASRPSCPQRRARPGRGLLARRADAGLPRAAVADVGPRATPAARSRSGCRCTRWRSSCCARPVRWACRSANRSGQPPATTCDEAAEQLGDSGVGLPRRRPRRRPRCRRRSST